MRRLLLFPRTVLVYEIELWSPYLCPVFTILVDFSEVTFSYWELHAKKIVYFFDRRSETCLHTG